MLRHVRGEQDAAPWMQWRDQRDDQREPPGGVTPTFHPTEPVLGSTPQTPKAPKIKPRGECKRNQNARLKCPLAFQLIHVVRSSLVMREDGSGARYQDESGNNEFGERRRPACSVRQLAGRAIRGAER